MRKCRRRTGGKRVNTFNYKRKMKTCVLATKENRDVDYENTRRILPVRDQREKHKDVWEGVSGQISSSVLTRDKACTGKSITRCIC